METHFNISSKLNWIEDNKLETYLLRSYVAMFCSGIAN